MWEVLFSLRTPTLLVAEDSYFNLSVKLSNHGDDSYNTSLSMHYPPGLSFSRMALTQVTWTLNVYIMSHSVATLLYTCTPAHTPQILHIKVCLQVTSAYVKKSCIKPFLASEGGLINYIMSLSVSWGWRLEVLKQIWGCKMWNKRAYRTSVARSSSMLQASVSSSD